MEEDKVKMEERAKLRMKELDEHLRAGFVERSEEVHVDFFP